MTSAVLAYPRQGPFRLATLPPLALYVHVPWCVRKCPYCDFNSHELRSSAAGARAGTLSRDIEAQYVAALTADIDFTLPQVWGRKVYSIFFGGGTPSLLSVAALDEILSVIRARLPLVPDAEITLEANPATFEAEKFAQFRALGINRLSIGIQSFNPQHLHALGRIHDTAEARRAVEIAHDHFDNINLDLMYALPEQTLAQAEADIVQAVASTPTHLSAYHLTIEPNTYFHRHPPDLPHDDVAASMQERIEARLAEAGYQHYETSAFARAGYACKHNLNYWRFGDYIGIGAGAHGKISLPDRIVRQVRWKHPRDYTCKALAHTPVQEEHPVQADDLPLEFMMNALRLTEGFPLRMFEERTGLPIAAILPPLQRAESQGLIRRDHETVAPTLRGQRFLNELLQLFVPASADA